MIICHSHKFIYVHPPKTAGTAVSTALGALCTDHDAQIGDWPGASYGKIPALKGIGKHAPLAAITPLALGVDLADYLVVLSVRNPWDRLASFYHWARAQSFEHPQIALAKAHSFAGFLALRRIQRVFSAAPYRSYAPKPDILLRAERLGADMQHLAGRLGVEIAPIQTVNTSTRQRDWRVYYTDETAAIVAKICAEDIAAFGYQFDDAANLPAG